MQERIEIAKQKKQVLEKSVQGLRDELSGIWRASVESRFPDIHLIQLNEDIPVSHIPGLKTIRFSYQDNQTLKVTCTYDKACEFKLYLFENQYWLNIHQQHIKVSWMSKSFTVKVESHYSPTYFLLR